MASILISSGLKHLESLQEFAMRFPQIASPLDGDLRNIWVCHKTAEEIPKFEEINSLPVEDYDCLRNEIKMKTKASKDFFSLMTEFSPLCIFDEIYFQFKKQLATYLFTKCYLFYNWGINAFEPVLDHFEIHKQIEKSQKKSVTTKPKKVVKNFSNYFTVAEYDKQTNSTLTNRTKRGRSVDLFEEPVCVTKKSKSKVNVKALRKAVQKAERFFDIPKNPNNPYHETFNFKKMLYNMKQLPQWPKKHVLSKHNVEDLMAFIVRIPVISSFVKSDKPLNDHKNWSILRGLLQKFIEQHKVIDINNGYGRILKKHLKNVIMPSERKLFAIPPTIVCSYIIDILRRVLPLDLFGRRYLRKHFFNGITKVIKAAKEQNFIWYSLLHLILKNKAELAWCSEIETGSSGFGLRYYRKSDMESMSFICLKNLLEKKQIQPLRRKDYDPRTLERDWLETGQIKEEEAKGKIKKILDHESEYKQPVAQVRFLPKNDEGNELRLITNIRQSTPICSGVEKDKLERLFAVRLSWRKKKLFFVKLLLDFLVEKYGFGIRPEPFNPVLEATWKKVMHLKESHGKLFFIKADISDAFGSVKYDILTEILRKTLEEDSSSRRIQLKKIIEWKKTKWKIEKVVRFSFSNRTKENSIMINRSVFLHHNKKINQCYDSKFLDIIKQVVMKQRVEIKGRVFRMIKGLAQGNAGRFSPQLCEIYYSSMDRICFKEFINAADSILLRAVDDYLFITYDFEKARKFLKLVQRGIDEYEVRFNNSKLRSNLIENIKEVPYLGLTFNFEDMSVRPNYSKYQHTDLLSTVNMFDQWGNCHFNKTVFLERRSLRIGCLKLHSIVLNSFHSNLKIIRQTVFEACLVQSLRVIKLANYLYSGGIMNDLEIFKILLKSCNKIKNTVGASLLSRDEFEKCEKAFTKVASELLLDFLKDDILEEDYWNRVSSLFRELGNKPMFIKSS